MKIKVWVSLSLAGCTKEVEIEVPAEDYAGMTEHDRDIVLEEYARDAMFEMIEWSWSPLDQTS
jgi:hypothetical protein